MSHISDNPTPEEALRVVLNHWQSKIWTAIPGTVHTYEAETQRASIKPAVIGYTPLADGEELEELPLIPNVPIVHPAGGGFMVAFPIKPGNPVLLVFCARDIASWKAGDGEVSEAADNRMHSLTDAFAIPGGKPTGAVLQQVDTDKLVIGQEGGHQIRIGEGGIDIGTAQGTKQAVALASAAHQQITAVSDTLNTHIGHYNLHGHPPIPPATVPGVSPPSMLSTPASPVMEFGSASVNVEV